MKSLLTLMWMALCLTAANAASVFTFPFDRVELENGFRAYLIQVPGSGQIAYVTAVRTGSREEWEPGRSGYAHFFEHMMFRGTRKYPDFSGVLTRLGADHNAFTSSDMTVYYEVASASSLEQLMDLESDRFMNLDYAEPDFRTEAGAVLGEYNQGRANPFSFLNEALRNTAFDRHTYKHTTIGFEADVPWNAGRIRVQPVILPPLLPARELCPAAGRRL
jgi:zinc protease